MRNAVTSTVQITAIQCNPSFDYRPFDANFTGSFIFVPSFSVGPISVGFGVQECFTTCFADWCTSPEAPQTWYTNHFRYVRDDSQGVLLMFFRDPRTACVKMDCMKHATASSRRRVFCVFDQDALQNAVHTEQGVLPTDAVLNALTMINFLTEARQCPVCTMKARTQCTCQIHLTPPAHPLDFAPLQRNMSLYLGCYEGLAKSSVMRKGAEVFSANVGSRIEIVGGIDDDLLTRLSRWAISDQLKHHKEDPLALTMPSLPGGQQDPLFQGMSVLGAAAPHMEQASLPIDAELFGTPLNTSSCSSGSAAGASQGDVGGTGVLVVDRLGDERSCHDAGVGIAGALGAEFMAYGDSAHAWAGIGGEEMMLVNSPTGEKRAADLWQVEGMQGEGDSAESNTNNNEPTIFDMPTSLGVDVASNMGRTRALSIAPATAVETTATRKQDEKQLRAELRKQRNREAAQRSNARRKLKNDSLKQALKEVHAKAAELRARELSLREENLRLRKLTS
eukprot:GFKZ01011179.1.p1 GENE.GFKZ01011179.1~~GFKZ01011179.1.p1  ORF type:complete len:592 (-),score=61.47 GFKZ01011179.1:1229-2746(-)